MSNAPADPKRASLGFDDALDSFDPNEWAPRKNAAANRPQKAATKKAAEAAGFKSREPAPSTATDRAKAPAKAAPFRRSRMRITGRNQQFNMKATPAAIAEFCAIADENDWVLGEALEHAIKLMRLHLPKKTPKDRPAE